jgi:hypothetical protein
MNDAEIEFYISRILSGFLIFFYNNERYELQYPNCYLRYESNLIYNNIINDEKYGEWIREENLIRVLIMLGLWTQETEKTIGQIEKQIENLKVDLYNNILNKTMQTKIRSNLRAKEEQLNRILNIKQEFLGNTLEGYAASIKNEYIVCNTLYKNKKLVFNIDDVKSSSSYQYFNNLINEVNQHMIPIKAYKAIARSHTWRSYWNCNKNNIFNKQVIDWTDEQRSLINITKMYDNIYEHPECPGDNIIEDDDVLDGWLIVQKRKIAKAKVQQTIDSSNPKLKNAQEVFVMASDQDSREEVFGLNSGEALHRMKEKFAYINSMNNSESVEDLSLPDVRREAISKTRTAPQN